MKSYLDSLFSLHNKIAIVTGAARGNGKAISEALGKSGAKVILIDILEKELKNTEKNLQKKGIKVKGIVADITKEDEIKRIIKIVKRDFKKIDILVNNAGVTFPSNFINYSEKDWEKTFDVNLKSVFRISQELAKIMIKQKSGVIINIGSISAVVALPNNPAYNASKAALVQLSKSMALDLGNYGIRVNCLTLGYFKTKMTQKSWNSIKLRKKRTERTILGRWGESKDLTGIIIFLASNASNYITGENIFLDGGWTSKGL